MSFILAEAERLHALGFAVHWLRPKSKVPYNGGWTKGPRATLRDLKTSYKQGMNIGVRLGHASDLGGSYLAVLDVDIKSSSAKHRNEALAALEKILPGYEDSPHIYSGRGNYSAHYYVRLKTPISGNELKAQSSEMVQVLMPSVPTNRHEEETLSIEDLARGVRLRKAWEISLMSEGRQCVLAGSVHPDTGKKYRWGMNLDFVEDIPLFDPGVTAAHTPKEARKASAAVDGIKAWDFKDVDVDTLGLKQEQVDAIRDGANVTDASAKVYELTLALLSRGVSDDIIVSIFTDKTYHLGHTAFKHARTKNRRYAAAWVERYCLRKAKIKVGGSDFDFEEIEEPSDEELKRERSGKPKKPKQIEPDVVLWPVGFSVPPAAWEKELVLKSRGKAMAPLVMPVYSNVHLILHNSCEDANFLIYDTFSLNAYYTCDTPWGRLKGEQRSAGKEDALLIKSWLHEKYEMVPSLQMVEELLESATTKNSHHPVQEYLDGLEWDGVHRIDNALRTYFGATMPEPYLSGVSRKLFIGAVKRIFEPGCTFQYMVVLEGKQGIGKSTGIAMLASKRWFLDALPNLHDKDAALYLHGTWLCEIAELAALSKSGDNPTKAFITRDTDRFRPPYGARRQDFKRSTLFIGTTNFRDYLTDPTGNRRYWPVLCTHVDFDALARDRDQLWAEAVWEFYTSDEKLYLVGEALLQAERIQELARAEDEIDYMVEGFRVWERDCIKEEGSVPAKLTMLSLFETAWAGVRADKGSMMRAAHALRQLGYEKVKKEGGNIWIKKGRLDT